MEFIKENGFARIVNHKGSFLNLFFRFINHSYKVSEGEILIESMLFCIDDRLSGKTIFEKKIEFSETYFMNVVNKNKHNDKRQQWLLDISDELMKPLQHNKFAIGE